MMLRPLALALLSATVAAAAAPAGAQPSETFVATATATAADGKSVSAPITVIVARTMARDEAEKLMEAFKRGGAAELRRALTGVPPTGSIQLGPGAPTTTRLAIARPTAEGRLITIVAETPILFIGGNVKGAKAKEGYDFAVLDLSVDAAGKGYGTLMPAAKVTVNKGAFVVDDYAADVVRLSDVTRAK